MKKKMWRTGLCGLTACSMLFTMPALAWAADEPQNTNIDNGLIAYYDFENVNEKKVPNVQGEEKYAGTLSGDNVSVEDGTLFGKSLKFTEGTQGAPMFWRSISFTSLISAGHPLSGAGIS